MVKQLLNFKKGLVKVQLKYKSKIVVTTFLTLKELFSKHRFQRKIIKLTNLKAIFLKLHRLLNIVKRHQLKNA